MIDFVRTLFANKRLLKELVVRDLKARYVGSSMGFFWSVIFPILNLVVYTFVFRIILAVRFDDNAGVKETAIWMLAGIVVWGAFAETLSRATNCLVENANLIQKVVFPAGVLPVYLTISSIVNMAIGMPVVILGVLWFGYISPSDVPDASEQVAVVASLQEAQLSELQEWKPADFKTSACNKCAYEHVLACPNDGSPLRILAAKPKDQVAAAPVRDLELGKALLVLPLLMFLQGCFTAGLGLFLSAFNLILRDTYHMVGVFVMVWMFGTPIFYPPALVVSRDHGAYSWILEINPMYWLIDSYRNVLLYNDLPNPVLFGQFVAVAFIALVLGSTFFSSQRARFPDLL